MNRASKIYAVGISILGLSLGVACTVSYFMGIASSADRAEEIVQFIILWILYLVCECLPIYIREDLSFDMSFICDLAAILAKGPVAAAALVLLSTPFMVRRSAKSGGKLLNIFNTPPIKTAFNAANIILSIYIAGKVYLWLGGPVGELSVLPSLLPGVALILCIVLLNSSILLGLFAIGQNIPFFPSLLKNTVEFLPNMAAAAPIGYFLANFMSMQGGEYLTVLFMLPLLLARYSFVLYLDAKNNYYNMIQTLSAALEAKDPYTEGHSHMVELYSEKVARKMGLSERRVEAIRVGALLHDIGKIGIEDGILNKPGRLTDEERQVIVQHPRIGNDILKNVQLSEMTRSIILHHHERYDGGGYPDHMKGDDLPIDVYIVSAADAFDAMTSKRPYSRCRARPEAMQVLREESGAQFHPKVVEAFDQILREESSEGGGR